MTLESDTTKNKMRKRNREKECSSYRVPNKVADRRRKSIFKAKSASSVVCQMITSIERQEKGSKRNWLRMLIFNPSALGREVAEKLAMNAISSASSTFILISATKSIESYVARWYQPLYLYRISPERMRRETPKNFQNWMMCSPKLFIILMSQFFHSELRSCFSFWWLERAADRFTQKIAQNMQHDQRFVLLWWELCRFEPFNRIRFFLNFHFFIPTLSLYFQPNVCV